MSIEEPPPSLIAERGCLLGRPDDVGEQHGRKDAIGVLRRLPRSHLLLSPGERLHVPARWDSVRRPVAENGDSGREGPGVDELQVRDVRRGAEETLATSKHHGKHHEAILVDHVMCDERVEKVGAAEEQYVTARLLFQLGDLLGGVPPDDDRVLPARRPQALGDDVLRDGVHPLREAFIVRSRRPERGEDLVGHAPEENGAGLGEFLGLVSLLVVAGIAQGPGVLPVRMLVMPGRFHHAVERHEFRCDQPSHRILRAPRPLARRGTPSKRSASVPSIATDSTWFIGPSSPWKAWSRPISTRQATPFQLISPGRHR
jgi:hypothetical protein